MYFLMTNDVESFSIPLNRCDKRTAEEVYKVGLPRLLDLYSKYDIPSTFYFTGEFVEMVPEAIDIVKDHGHEIGCHGYSHDVDRALDILTYKEQLNELKKAKKTIESVAGRIESFRAPALRINKDTIKVLEKLGFKSDSSLCPQRFDGPFTFGSRRKLKWLIAPRKPHYIYSSSILEIPISAIILSYSGTTLRRSPLLTKIIEKFLFFESKYTEKPIVFLFHPNECLDFDGNIVTTRRSQNFISYLFADYLRQRLKLKNLGKESLLLLENILNRAKAYGFEFITISRYRKKCTVK